ncbi:MAG: hypothetical protein ABF271_09385 [Abyssibacter sp.]|uniref:hypothetical protein n=1 Tax=Abyssibacter sp. TaxID=2320200 RepID=UPI0032191149
MADIPTPRPGLVIRYSYLWKSEHDRGYVEGQKDRPCAIVVAVAADGPDHQVAVVPVTHSAPSDPSGAIQLTAATRRRLGLDEEASWIITSELNVFHWPGPDLRMTPTGQYAYGELPARVFEAIKEQILDQPPVEVGRTE